MSRPARYSRCVCCGKEFKWKACNAGMYCSHECAKADQTQADGRRAITTISAEWRSSRGCAVCGITVLPVLESHHVDRTTKQKNLKDIRSVAALEYELSHSICLCRNHHKLYEWEETREGRGLEAAEVVSLIRHKYPETLL